MNCCRFSIGLAAVVMLVALRVGTGWHFFSQGVDHYRDRNWSSEGFLRQAKGPWAEFYKSQVPDFHGFGELIAHPWREVETKRETAKPIDQKAKQTESKKTPQPEPAKSKDVVAAAANGEDSGPALSKEDEKKASIADAPSEGDPQPTAGEAKKTSEAGKSTKDDPPKQPTEGEPNPESKKKGPATKAEEKLAEELAVARPIYDEFAKRVIEDWSDRRHEIATHYDFDDAQRQQAAEVFDRYKQGFLNYLAGIESDLKLYQRELRRLDAMQSFQGSSDIPFASKRVADKEREVANQPSAWLADFRRMERELDEDVAAIATENQEKAGPPPGMESPLKQKDRILTWAMLICGGCLIVGLFTRIAAVACAAFLFLVIMSQPPWVPGTVTTLFPYQLIEMLALLTLATTAVGRWGGLDFFIHFLVTAPFRSRR